MNNVHIYAFVLWVILIIIVSALTISYLTAYNKCRGEQCLPLYPKIGVLGHDSALLRLYMAGDNSE